MLRLCQGSAASPGMCGCDFVLFISPGLEAVCGRVLLGSSSVWKQRCALRVPPSGLGLGIGGLGGGRPTRDKSAGWRRSAKVPCPGQMLAVQQHFQNLEPGSASRACQAPGQAILSARLGGLLRLMRIDESGITQPEPRHAHRTFSVWDCVPGRAVGLGISGCCHFFRCSVSHHHPPRLPGLMPSRSVTGRTGRSAMLELRLALLASQQRP